MSIVTANGLSKYYGAELIFDEVSFQVARGDKIALVGVNGAGKSTLVKIIAGLEPPSEGRVAPAKGQRLAYLTQEPRFEPGRTLWNEMEHAFDYLQQVQQELSALEHAIADHAAPTWEQTMERYGELQARFELAGGYEMDQRIRRTLQGLSFREEQYHQQLSQFSGGQKTRAALAATLLSNPDLLLLDEPTNHLDLEALEWLEGFLKAWQGALIVISHDRYFLDRVTTRTWEMAFGRMEDYPGAYTRYLELKAERMERRLKDFEAQQEFIARTEEFIRRNKAGQRSKEAKGREKRLNRLKETLLKEKPRDASQLKIFLDSKLRSGELTLALDKLVVGYPPDLSRNGSSQPTELLRIGELSMQRGQRVALLGPNGAGKTTLLRTLVGELPRLGGSLRLGHNVQVGYYAQGHDQLDFAATVLEEVRRVEPLMSEERARTILGTFLFSGDDVFKPVSALSGGERSRLALAQLTLKPGNLLVLDEPTNHLDIQAREALEGVLNAYGGSILFVSHDRYFIDAVADTIWMLRDGGVEQFFGNYSEYAAQQARLAEQETQRQTGSSQQPAGNNRQSGGAQGEDRRRKRRQQQIEAEVARIEAELKQLSGQIEQAGTRGDVARITSLGERYAQLESQLHERYDEWSQVAE
jgi:ATP-binding cassette subfamily F protein 3